MNRLFAGAGREEIRFPGDIFPFKEGKDIWSGIHDIPCVRVLLFENDSRFGFISIETVFIRSDLAEEIKELVAGISGVAEDHLWLSLTHTTSTPHMFEWDYEGEGEENLGIRMQGFIKAAAADAAKTAAECMRPVSFGFGSGYCTVNANRMIPTCDGWWIGCNEEGPSDHSVPVIRLDDENGDPFIIIYSYACENSVMDGSIMRDGGRHITADLAGVTSGIVEKTFGGDVIAAFLPGLTGDQGPVYHAKRTIRGLNGSYDTVDIRDDGWLLLQLAAERLAEQVVLTAEKISCDNTEANVSLHCRTFTFPGQKLKGLPNPLKAPISDWVSVPDDDRTRTVEIFIINDLAIICAGGMSITAASKIKSISRFKHTVITDQVYGHVKALPTDGAKGMADAASYDLGTVHAKNSEFAKGSAEMMVENITGMLQNLA